MYMKTILKLGSDHEWIKYDTQTKIAKMGITDYPQKELGYIVYVDFQKLDWYFNHWEQLKVLKLLLIFMLLFPVKSLELMKIQRTLQI